MSDYIIEKTLPQLEPMRTAEVDTYLIKYTKTAKQEDGKEVTVIDEQRTEEVTVKQLEAQKLNYQDAIKEIEAKLKAITTL